MVRTSKRSSGRRRNRAEIQQLLQQYARSSLRQHEFAVRAGVGYSTLTRWLRQARQGKRPRAGQSQWLPVEVLPPTVGTGYQIHWSDGTSLQVSPGFALPEVQHLVELLRPCSR